MSGKGLGGTGQRSVAISSTPVRPDNPLSMSSSRGPRVRRTDERPMTHRRRCGGTATLPPPTPPGLPSTGGSHDSRRTLCTDLPPAEPGSTVRLQGWVHRRRELASSPSWSSATAPGSPRSWCAARADVPPEETPVEVVGTATANPQAPGGVEVTEPTIRALSDDADTPPVELWRPTLNASLPTMLDHAAVTWRHPLQRAKWELAAASLKGFRATLDAGGFTEICSPSSWSRPPRAAPTSSGRLLRPAGVPRAEPAVLQAGAGRGVRARLRGRRRCSAPSRTTRSGTWRSTSASTSSSASSRTTAR